MSEQRIDRALGLSFFVFVVGLAVLVTVIGAVISGSLSATNGDLVPLALWLAVAVVGPTAWVMMRRHRAVDSWHLIERGAVATLVAQALLVPVALAVLAM